MSEENNTSDTELTLDVGQANEFKLACRRAGWKNKDIKTLCEGDSLAQILPFIRGNAVINVIEHFIDCSLPSQNPDLRKEQMKMTISTHCFKGILKWDRNAQKDALYQYVSPRDADMVKRELEDNEVVVLPDNVLDYLLAHPRIIPDEWKGKYVCFWGTIYHDEGGCFYVRCLDWEKEAKKWGWHYSWSKNGFSHLSPAALPAS
jgi:hypothetical protein